MQQRANTVESETGCFTTTGAARAEASSSKPAATTGNHGLVNLYFVLVSNGHQGRVPSLVGSPLCLPYQPDPSPISYTYDPSFFLKQLAFVAVRLGERPLGTRSLFSRSAGGAKPSETSSTAMPSSSREICTSSSAVSKHPADCRCWWKLTAARPDH